MSENTFSIFEIPEVIAHLPDHFEHYPEVVTIVQHGKPVMAILTWELYESLIETLEVMSDSELMAIFRQGAEELAREKGRAWEGVKKDLDLS